MCNAYIKRIIFIISLIFISQTSNRSIFLSRQRFTYLHLEFILLKIDNKIIIWRNNMDD